MAIQTVIFDIGKVLVDYDWTVYFMDITHDEDKTNRLKNAYFQAEAWQELDRGIIPTENILNTIISHEPELKNEIRETFYNMDKLLAQYPYSKDWIRDLKGRGYQVLYLSNWSQHLIDQSPRSVDFIPLMDGGIFSYKVKLVKPDHQIYKKLIDSYKLNPNECVFLDDKKENIHAAKECGLNGIIVESYAQSSSELEKLLLEK